MSYIKIFDTTLRDGTQAEGFSLGIHDKITIAKALDDLGVHYIEGGWPGSNPRDLEFFKKMKSVPLPHAKLCAFGATHHKKFTQASDCPSLQKTIECGVQTACIFGKTWDLHAKQLLGLTRKENNRLIQNSIKFLVDNGLEVLFDAEHFFDGYDSNPQFALSSIESAINGGASNITLCDTNGGMLPDQIFEITKIVCEKFPNISIGIHVHDDGGLAVSNSLSAIKAGADLVQGTINGIGERCGNANLCSIIPNLQLKMGYTAIGKENLLKLKKISEIVALRGNYNRPKNLPFVGNSAFAHKGGIHVSAVQKNPLSYESIKPELVGNKRKITISDLSGKSNLKNYAEKKGYNLAEFSNKFWNQLLKDLKQVEKEGLQFEGAENSFDIFFARHLPLYTPPFIIENFYVHTSKQEEKETSLVEATVEGIANGKKFHTAGKGFGPVGALDDALRKGLIPEFPQLKKIYLTDFKVRITEMESGTGAKTRVVMEHSDGEKTWTTVGVSQNIIEASIDGLIDAYEWYVTF